MMESAKIYRSFRDAARQMPDDERLKFWDALMDYALDGTEPAIGGVAGIVFTAIRPTIDNRTESVVQGTKGGRPKKGGFENSERGVFENSKGGFSETQKGGFEKPKTYAEAEEEAEVEEEKKKARFTPPTLSEVKAYCQERVRNGHPAVNPEAFVDFYASKGWKVGNQSMKDWKAAVRTWEKRETKMRGDPARKKTQWDDIESHSYDVADLEQQLVGM